MTRTSGFAYDIGTNPQATEGHLGVLPSHGGAAAGDEEGRLGAGVLLSAVCDVRGQDLQ